MREGGREGEIKYEEEERGSPSPPPLLLGELGPPPLRARETGFPFLQGAGLKGERRETLLSSLLGYGSSGGGDKASHMHLEPRCAVAPPLLFCSAACVHQQQECGCAAFFIPRTFFASGGPGTSWSRRSPSRCCLLRVDTRSSTARQPRLQTRERLVCLTHPLSRGPRKRLPDA